MIISFFILIVATFGSFYILNNFFYEILAMSLALFIGSLLSFILSVYFIINELKINLYDFKKILFSLFSIFIGVVSSSVDLDIYSKILIYFFYILLVLYLFKINIFSLIRRNK